MHVEMVLNYRVMPDRAPEVYRNIGLNVSQQYLARWDGRLPQYSFGGNAVPFVQVAGAPAGGARR